MKRERAIVHDSGKSVGGSVALKVHGEVRTDVRLMYPNFDSKSLATRTSTSIPGFDIGVKIIVGSE